MTDGPGVAGTPPWERRRRGWQGPAEGSVKDPSLVARGKCCRKVKKRIGGGGGGDQPQRFRKISKPRMTSARVLFREWLPQRAVCRARWMVDWELDVSLSKSWAVGR